MGAAYWRLLGARRHGEPEGSQVTDLFGARVEAFHTVWWSLFKLILSVTEGIDYPPLYHAAPGASMMWLIGWTLISNLILANFLIAIVCESFTTMQNREAKKEALTKDYPRESFAQSREDRLRILKERSSV